MFISLRLMTVTCNRYRQNGERSTTNKYVHSIHSLITTANQNLLSNFPLRSDPSDGNCGDCKPTELELQQVAAFYQQTTDEGQPMKDEYSVKIEDECQQELYREHSEWSEHIVEQIASRRRSSTNNGNKYRDKRSDEQKEAARVDSRNRKRQQRANETEKEVQLRREAQRRYAREKRTNEIKTEANRRHANQSRYQRAKRDRETETETEMRLAAQRRYQRMKRDNETELENQRRLAAQADARRIARRNESFGQAERRRQYSREYQRERRLLERLDREVDIKGKSDGTVDEC